MNFEKFREINNNPSRLGILEDYSAKGSFHNPGCGDDYEIYLRIEEGKITDAKFKTTGCGFGLAALQLTLEESIGKSVAEARNIDPEAISQGIDGFPPGRYHYISEAFEALCSALDDAEAA